MSKFHNKSDIVFVNPNTDYFNNIGGSADPIFLDKTHPPFTYDLVHIHFSFDKLNVTALKKLLNYFKKNNKPIVWTCHSRVSQRKKDIGKGKLQKMLFEKSDSIITLTEGCRKWILNNLGKSKSVEVIPHGYIMNPEMIDAYKHNLALKKRENFIYLAGDLRKNKEVVCSIKGFLNNKNLKKCTLTLVYKKNLNHSKKTINFIELLNSDRVKKVCLTEISNHLLNKLFCESHVCVLPYLWGTHSGQIELSRDCGCHAVISDVGFYQQQHSKVLTFKFNKNLLIFSKNFNRSLNKAYKLPLLKPDSRTRKLEFKKILRQHIKVYKKLI